MRVVSEIVSSTKTLRLPHMHGTGVFDLHGLHISFDETFERRS